MHLLDITGFRTAVNESFVPLRVTSDHADDFVGALDEERFGDLHLTRVQAGSHAVERTPELISAASRSYFKLSMMVAGSALLAQDGRETVLRPGDLAIYDTGRPYTLLFEERFQTLVVMFPRELMSIPVGQIADLTAVRLDPDKGLTSLASAFFTQLAAQHVPLAGSSGTRLAQSAVDLVSALYAQELGTSVSRPDAHTDLVQRIMAFIDDRLDDAALDPAGIAAAHFISTRHLHGLFNEQETTVSTWIRARRLERCRRDLADAGLAAHSVSDISMRWGFVNAAHFSRAFKARFGISPSAFRAERARS